MSPTWIDLNPSLLSVVATLGERFASTRNCMRLGGLGERQFAFLYGCGCELQSSKDVIPFQVRVVDDDLLDAAPSRELAQDSAHCDPGIPDTGQPTHPGRVDGNPLVGHLLRVRQSELLRSAAGPRADHPDMVTAP